MPTAFFVSSLECNETVSDIPNMLRKCMFSTIDFYISMISTVDKYYLLLSVDWVWVRLTQYQLSVFSSNTFVLK